MYDIIKTRGIIHVVHRDIHGNIKSEETTHNLVTNEGINYLLNTGLHDGAGHSISGEVGGTGNGVATAFSYTLSQLPYPGTLTVGYTIGAVTSTVTDDGAGNISDANVTGTINYSTGAVSLTFGTAPDNATNITNDYSATITAWYFAPWSATYTPVATDTYAVPGFTEATTEISETTRQEWVEGSSTSQQLTNSVAATITAAAAVTVYGVGLAGGGTAASTKGDTTGGGILMSSAAFATSKALATGETLDITYTLSAS